MIRFLLAVSLLSLAACGDECERGDMLASPGGLELSEDEHPDGWGRAECAQCHVVEAIHGTACTDGVDLAEVRATVDAEGPESCGSCHGANGVEE